MKNPVWVPFRAIIVIHDRQIVRHDGVPGVRDLALLEMGCARAMNLAAYADAGMTEIAAKYAFGIAKAHAFVDGNKRTAFVAAVTLLRLNGYALRSAPVEGVRMMEGLPAGDVSEAEFAACLQKRPQAELMESGCGHHRRFRRNRLTPCPGVGRKIISKTSGCHGILPPQPVSLSPYFLHRPQGAEILVCFEGCS